MKKTATITWSNHNNFGTFLQAYALQFILKKLGYCNDIIDDQRIINASYRKSYIIEVFRPIYRILKSIILNEFLFKRKTKSSEFLFNEFKIKHLDINSSYKDLKEVDLFYDSFICGSDQIWSPLPGIYNPFYFMSFTKKTKLSYAPSIGVNSIDNSFKLLLKNHLSEFKDISVREDKAREILSDITKRDVKTLIDPTLLLSSDEWNSLISHIQIKKEDYVLCYLLTFNLNYINKIIEFAKTKNLKIKIFGTNKNYAKYFDDVIFVGPSEFLFYIKNSTYFFTDSFHGTIFSIIFKIKFIVFKRFEDKDPKCQNSRIYNLLHIFKLKHQVIDKNDSLISVIENIEINEDYNYIDNILEIERNKSFNYLTSNL